MSADGPAGRPALLVLGFHRSGTSLVAGMAAAAGWRVPGPAVRNWDNPHGHHEATAAVRLNEAILAASGGHAYAPPATLRWDDDHAAARDRLLAPGTLIKDPRCLLTLPFWRLGPPAALVAVVRRPLAAARSLWAWRGIAIDDGLRLWLRHARALDGLPAPVVDADAPLPAIAARVAEILSGLGAAADPAALLATADPDGFHHDGIAGDDADPGLLAEAAALHARLLPDAAPAIARGFPRALLDRVRAGDADAARELVAAAPDPASALAPAAAALLRQGRADAVPALADLAEARGCPTALTALVRGKALLDRDPAAAAVAFAHAAAAGLWEGRSLAPEALWRAGKRTAARAALPALAADAVWPHTVNARAAEWAWLDGDRTAALAAMAAAIAAAPPNRRGRLRARRAAWLDAIGEPDAAAAERAIIPAEDPAWAGTPP